jgi:hypothetical protein
MFNADGSEFASERDTGSEVDRLSELNEESEGVGEHEGINVTQAMQSLGLEDEPDHPSDVGQSESDDGFSIVPHPDQARRQTRSGRHTSSTRMSTLRSQSSPSRSPIHRLRVAARRGELHRVQSPLKPRSFYLYVFS